MKKFALLLLVAPLALVACGSSHRASAIDQVRAAIAKTANTSAVHLVARLSATQWNAGNHRYTFRRVDRGDADNASGVDRMTLRNPRTRAVLTSAAIYTRIPALGSGGTRWGRWARISLGELKRARWDEYVQSYIPYSPASLGRVRRATEVAPGLFRVLFAGAPGRAEVRIAGNGYVTRLRYREGPFDETVTLSRFGEHLNLAIPQSSEVVHT